MSKLLVYTFAVMLFFGVICTPNTLHEDFRLGVGDLVYMTQEPVVISERDRMQVLTSRGEAREMQMEITAYDLSFESCGKHPWEDDYGITASGEYAQEGFVAVDPTVIPLNTRVWIDGYGMAVAKDTGGAIKGLKIDIFMPKMEDCDKWGRQTRTVYILGGV